MEHQSHLSRKKAKALIAILSVVGVGAVTTLAAWTATSYLSGSITTGDITGILVEGSPTSADTSTWATHPLVVSDGTNNGAATISFGLDGVPALGPGGTVYAPVGLALKQGTTFPLNLKIRAKATSLEGTGTSRGDGITYSVMEMSTFSDCKATLTNGNTVAALGTTIGQDHPLTGTAFDGPWSTGTVALPAATSTGNGAAKFICVKVSVTAASTPAAVTDLQFELIP